MVAAAISVGIIEVKASRVVRQIEAVGPIYNLAPTSRSQLAQASAPSAILFGGVVVGLPAGVLVDRWYRRRVLLAASTTGAHLSRPVPAGGQERRSPCTRRCRDCWLAYPDEDIARSEDEYHAHCATYDSRN